MLLEGNRAFDGVGIAPDVRIISTGSAVPPARPGCAPIGGEVATIDDHGDDATLAIAVDILTRSADASRTSLLEAAKSIAQIVKQRTSEAMGELGDKVRETGGRAQETSAGAGKERPEPQAKIPPSGSQPIRSH
jgi:hypothetical protein